MRQWLSGRRPSPAFLIACVALFVALGSTSWAQDLARNAIGKAELGPDSVGKSEIRADAVGKSEVLTDGIGKRELRAGSVGTAEVRDGELLAEDFAPGQLPRGPQGPRGPAGEDGRDAGTGGGGGAGTLTVRTRTAPVTIPCRTDPDEGFTTCSDQVEVTVRCAEGERATGGGYGPNTQGSEGLDRPDPTTGTPTGWTVRQFLSDDSPPPGAAEVDVTPDPVHVVCLAP